MSKWSFQHPHVNAGVRAARALAMRDVRPAPRRSRSVRQLRSLTWFCCAWTMALGCEGYDANRLDTIVSSTLAYRRSYVSLPGGLVSANDSVTLEFWLTWWGDPQGRYERIFDFGSGSGSRVLENPNFESTLFLSPNFDDGVTTRLQFRAPAGPDAQVSPPTRFPAGAPVHVVVVLNSDEQLISLYLDGALVGSAPWEHKLAELRDSNVWLGRSRYPDDPNLYGTFEEFRIYDVPLSADEIARNYARGSARLR